MDCKRGQRRSLLVMSETKKTNKETTKTEMNCEAMPYTMHSLEGLRSQWLTIANIDKDGEQLDGSYITRGS